MSSRRRRSSLELELQRIVTPGNPSVQAPHAGDSDANANSAGPEQQLEPADGGAAAWKILAAAFVFEAVLFGKHHLTMRRKRLFDEKGPLT